MSSIALPLLRIRFKRPRWPRGDRSKLLWAIYCGLNAIACVVFSMMRGNTVFIGLGAAHTIMMCLHWRDWQRSRDEDDDGPDTA